MKLRLKTFEVSEAALRGMDLSNGPKRAAAKKILEGLLDEDIRGFEERGADQKIRDAQQRIPELEAELKALRAIVSGSKPTTADKGEGGDDRAS